MQCVMTLNIVYSVWGGDFAPCSYLEFFKFQNRASNIIDEVTFRANDTLWNNVEQRSLHGRNELQSIELVSAQEYVPVAREIRRSSLAQPSGLTFKISHYQWTAGHSIQIYTKQIIEQIYMAPTCFVQRRKQSVQNNMSRSSIMQRQVVSSDEICKTDSTYQHWKQKGCGSYRL
ncbi:Hypothetical_protein [Hexamita inflata]|uniref:Hypothetical_protein n=1 Tax=Hexamita inflata TaxID=28002 RepID=A0AA86P2X9_9EUKA|nr:Hypothetical protein HINF_LOCUS17079 [Hexamita inflata]